MKRRLQSATDRPRRTRNARRAILTAMGLTLAIAAVPASASAALRTLSIDDPQGDASALSGPVLDLKSLAVRYDDGAGTLHAVWTYYNDVRADQSAYVGGMFNVQSPWRPNVPSDSGSVSWWGGMSYTDPVAVVGPVGNSESLRL